MRAATLRAEESSPYSVEHCLLIFGSFFAAPRHCDDRSDFASTSPCQSSQPTSSQPSDQIDETTIGAIDSIANKRPETDTEIV